jgi:hypothetical protein
MTACRPLIAAKVCERSLRSRHRASEQPFQMVDCVIGKHCRVGEAPLIAIEEPVCPVAQGADSLTACVGEVIEALCQLAPTFCSTFLAMVLDGVLLDSWMQPSREPELVPPDMASTEETHMFPFIARNSDAVASPRRAQIFSDNASSLGHELSRDVSHVPAIQQELMAQKIEPQPAHVRNYYSGIRYGNVMPDPR